MVVVERPWSGKQRDRARSSRGVQRGLMRPLSGTRAVHVCPESAQRSRPLRGLVFASLPPTSVLSNSVHCLVVCPATDPHPTWGRGGLLTPDPQCPPLEARGELQGVMLPWQEPGEGRLGCWPVWSMWDLVAGDRWHCENATF